MKSLLLKNVNAVLPGRVENGVSIVVADGMIAAIGGDETAPGAEVIDLARATLLPGLIDVHIHGAVGIDVMDASAEQLGEVADFLATQGVTGWVPTFVPAADDNYASGVDAIAEAAQREAGARVLGVHYEGPFVNSQQCGALHTEYFRTYSGSSDVDRLPLPSEGVRMITLAPEIDGGVELVRELKSRGWVISIGHTRALLELLVAALAAVAPHMPLFMNAMAPLHLLAPGQVRWEQFADEFTCAVIAAGTV